MGWTKEIWRNEVAETLFELGSIKFQKDLWMNKLQGCQSDFTELINRFDGCGIPDHLEDFLSEGYLSDTEMTELKVINDLIDKTGEYKTQSDFEALWTTKVWQEIESKSCALLRTSFFSSLDGQSKTRDLINKYMDN